MKPIVSFIIPTLNSGKVLSDCLQSIRQQKFDHAKVEIIIIDGGSTDDTPKISNKFKCKIINNPLKTAESGKAFGIKKAQGEFVALIDSDNILPDINWLNQMLLPFKNNLVIGTEPWEYTYRPSGGFIERYSSLTGVNDPYSLIINNYDRKNFLRPSWNGLKIPVTDYPNYQTFSINQPLPSIGANGTVYRSSILKKYFHSSYLIDVDLLSSISSKTNNYLFAKVKSSIIHSYCESSISKFIRKQNRRVIDLYIYQHTRPTNLIKSQLFSNLKFSLYVALIFPMLIDTTIGFIKKPDSAWLFHPLACIITLAVYALNTIRYYLGILKPINRQQWQQ